MSSLDITKEDLQDFKKELLEEIQLLLHSSEHLRKRWLRTEDVIKLLKISPNTLQHLRNTKQIPFFKISGILYYTYEDIEKMMEKAKQDFVRFKH